MPPRPSRVPGTVPSGAKPRPVVQVFIDVTCPFSKKIFNSVTGDDCKDVMADVDLTFILYPQPWHAQATPLALAALAVQELAPASFIPYLTKLFEEREVSWTDETSCDRTYTEHVDLLATYAKDLGLDEAAFREAFAGAVQSLKFCAKFGRQNGIHVTPTVIVNGIIDNAVSSSWGKSEWTDLFAKL